MSASSKSKRASRARAERLLSSFTGSKRFQTKRLTLPDVSNKFLIEIGRLRAVEYVATRDGKTDVYRHEFKVSSRPLLAVSHDGKTLVIVGGRFRFTDAGITDAR